MRKKLYPFKGIRCRSWFIYNLLLFLRFGFNHDLRYKIAAEYVRPGESVLDVCSGAGDFKKFLPEDCPYACIDASPQFTAILSKKKINFHRMNLHKGIDSSIIRSDVCVTIGALCQFKTTSMDSLLEDFKEIARRVVVVEHIPKKTAVEGTLAYKANNYLIATDFTVNDREFSAEEFSRIMLKHGYRVRRCKGDYMVGCYEFPK